MASGWGSERDGNSSLSTDESGHVTPQLRTLKWLPSHAEWKLKSSQWATRMKKSVQHSPTLALLLQWVHPSCLPASSLYLTHANILLFSNTPSMSLPSSLCFCSAKIPVGFIPVPLQVFFFKYHLFSENSHRHPLNIPTSVTVSQVFFLLPITFWFMV